MVNGNMRPNLAPLRDMTLWNLIDLECDLSRSLKVKCDSVIGLPIDGFILMVTSNTAPKSALLRDRRLWNQSGLDFDLSRSLKIKSNGVFGLSTYAFLLMVNSNIGPNFWLHYEIWRFEIWVTLTLTFQDHSRSNLILAFNSPYIHVTSY